MNSISAVIITLNEEINIKRCLDSLNGIVDEIIVIDSFSKDKTKAICESYNLTFIERAWEGYSNTKNYANSLVNSDYTFSIDADEALSEELKQSILQLKNEAKNDTVWMFSRLTNYCGKWINHCGWYPDKKVRIWKTGDAQWEGNIHEKLVFEGSMNTVHLKGDLHHYSFHSISQHVTTINNFSNLTANERFARGKKTNAFKILFKPLYKFFSTFIIKLGFLDGFYGFVVSVNSAYSAFLKEIKLKQLKA